MTSRQVPVRLPAAVLVDLDALVASGTYRSRTAAIRAGIEKIIAIERERELDAAIVAGYIRHPPSPAEDQDAVAQLRAAIEDEPW
ncbi:ribbon-helix-helix domain-containing protein [Candidatus Poriferisodalis sp.]|uniref:ribbon-helix-helix domain-containing protein n=1 Tax=Candidatus Poriferisodalis sp. TaxID=3101277 RepID=UPI003B01F2B6